MPKPILWKKNTMKLLSKALLLGMSLGLASIAMAESFNEHSAWMVTSAYPSDTQMSSTAKALPENFKEQSEWAAVIPSHGPSQCAVTSSRWDSHRGNTALSKRFNDSSSNLC